MIYITEQETKKAPGITSLFVLFDYRPELVDIVKLCCGAVYDKNTKIWEMPLTNLAFLLDNLCLYDSIKLLLLPDKDVSVEETYELLDYKTKPYQYLLDGIKFGLAHDNWLLLDAPGLGKTLQCVYLAEELKRRNNIQHCLIICGVNTLKTNWKSEIEKHSNLSCRILGERRTKRTNKIRMGSVAERLEDLKNPIEEFFVITNVETLRNDDIIKELVKGKANHFDMIAADEVHCMKSPTSQQGKHFLKLTNALFKLAMTGTLLLNNPLDAYVPLKWLGIDKSTFTTFKYYYCNFTGTFNNILLGYRNLTTLKNLLEANSLRRTKDLLELPPKTIINEYIDMNPEQQNFYNNVKDGIVDQVDKVEMSTANLLAMVARLRQATACPSILTTESIESSKITRACELAEQIIENGDKVVIFSTFKETLNPIMKALEKYNPLLNTGDVNDLVINENKIKFQTDDKYKAFVATWQKCGTGITLTAANYMIFLDTPWTDGVYTLAQDRIYRIGTTDKVFIYNLICKDTFDERVLEIVEDKQALSDYVVDDKISTKGLASLKKYIQELTSSCTE